MKRTTVDRLFVTWIGATLVVWVGSLSCLWTWAFDSSGVSTLVTLAAVMFAIGASASVPLRLSRIAQWLAGVLGFGRAPALELLVKQRRPAGDVGVRAIRLALVTAIACAVVGGLLSTAAVFGGALAAHWLARSLLWTPLAWTVAKLVVQFVGMLPMAVGISAVMYTFSVVRRSFGRDPYGGLCRDWLWAMAVGTGVFGLLWWRGMHMLGLAMMTVVVLLVAVMAMRQRKGVYIRRLGPLVGPGPLRRRVAVAAGVAALTVILLVQGRILADIANVSFGLRVCCWALSLALLAVFIRRADRKSRPPGKAQELGATVGAMAVVIIQAALAIACFQGGRVAVACGAMAAACQVPLMAMAAAVLSRQRRLLAADGGALGPYVSCVSTAAGIGVVIYMIVCSLPSGYVVLFAGPLVLCGGRIISAIARERRPGNEWRWALLGVILMMTVTGMVLISLRQAGLTVGQATPGLWLTAVSRTGESSLGQNAGYLPITQLWRSDRITRAISRIMADPDDPTEARGHRGRWWTVAGIRRDLPEELPFRVYERGSVADPAAVPPGLWQGILVGGSERDFLQAAHTGGERFDGVFLAPLPAGHNEAWRCYNYRTLRRCRSRVHAGGVVVLRTQAAGDDLAAALAVARTFHDAIGPSWAVAEFNEGAIDLLLVGPAAAVHWPSWREGLVVVPTEKLWTGWSQIPAIRLVSPPGPRPKWRPSPAALKYWFQRAAAP